MRSGSASHENADLLARGDSAMNRGDRKQAMIDYMLLCDRADFNASPEETDACIDAHLRVGDEYFYSGHYIESLNYYLRGLELSDRSGDKHSLGVFYKNIGNIYSVFKDHEQSLAKYEEGLRHCGADSVLALKICQNMMGTYTELHDVAKARLYREKALRYRCDYPVGHFMNDYNYALLLHEEKEYDRSIALFRKTAAYARANSLDPKYECSAIEGLYKAYAAAGNSDSTFFYLNLCNEFARREGLMHIFSPTYRHLADFYDRMGDTQRAMQMRSRYLQVHDSIFDLRSFDMLRSQQIAYETGKTGREIMRLQRQEQIKGEVIRWQWIVIMTMVAAVTAVAMLLINVHRKKKKLDTSYRNLFNLNRQLTESHNTSVERERRLQAAIAARDREIALCLRKETTCTPDGAATPATAVQSKYSSSKLNENRRNELADKITRLMEEQKAFSSPDFCLDSLAGMVESNSRYVSQIINEEFGRNFSNYVNDYRVRLACERLSDIDGYGSLTVRAIGESVGFKSYTTFISVFKKTTGITPSLYMRLAREQAGK